MCAGYAGLGPVAFMLKARRHACACVPRQLQAWTQRSSCYQAVPEHEHDGQVTPRKACACLSEAHLSPPPGLTWPLIPPVDLAGRLRRRLILAAELQLDGDAERRAPLRPAHLDVVAVLARKVRLELVVRVEHNKALLQAGWVRAHMVRLVKVLCGAGAWFCHWRL